MDFPDGFAIVSAAGSRPKPLRWLDALGQGVKRFCGYDADDAGDRAAETLGLHGWERFRPEDGKDWNDQWRELSRWLRERSGADFGRSESPLAVCFPEKKDDFRDCWNSFRL